MLNKHSIGADVALLDGMKNSYLAIPQEMYFCVVTFVQFAHIYIYR